MTAIILYVAVLVAAAVLAPSSAVGVCSEPKGDPSFKLQFLCGKQFNVVYSSSIGTDLTCIVNYVSCNVANESLATMHTKLIANDEITDRQTYELTDLGNGVLSRYYVEGDFTRTQIITTYSDFYFGDAFKMGLLICKDGEELPSRKALVGIYVTDFTNELEKLNKIAPDDSMTLLDTCDPDYTFDYYGNELPDTLPTVSHQ